jgi:hypothetical protein
LTELLTTAETRAARNDATIDWQKLEQKLQQVPQAVLDEAEARVRNAPLKTPPPAPVETATPIPMEAAPQEQAPVQEPVQQAAPPIEAAQPMPELQGKDPNNVDHVVDLLNASDNVKDKGTKKQINAWMDTVPREVLSEAMQRTEGAPAPAPQFSVQDTTTGPVTMPEADVASIVNGLGDSKRMRGFSEQERDAHSYFSKFNPDLALKAIANDLVNQPTAYRNAKMKAFENSAEGPEPLFASQREAETYKGQGGAHAKLAADWVKNNLSPESQAKLKAHIDDYTKQKAKIKQAQKDQERKVRLKRANSEQLDKENKQELADQVSSEKPARRSLDDFDLLSGKFKASEGTSALHEEAHPVVLHELAKGNMTRALEALSESPSSELAGTIARKLKPFMGNVKVEIGPVSQYDPATNTITLRKNASEYEILHESSHAAMSHTMANKSHPVTRQINDIFRQVKDSLDGMYGASNPQEFVAEAWSNDQLRNRLSEMRVGNTNTSLWDKLIAAVRKFLGLPPNTKSVLDHVDSMLNEIISQPPNSRNGDSMYAQSIDNPNVGEKIMRGIDKTITSAPLMNAERATSFLASMEKLTTAGKALALRMLNLSALGQVGSKVVGQDAVRFADLVEKKAGYQGTMTEENYPLHRRLQIFAKSDRYQTWSTLVHDSTRADVNPEAPRTKYVGSPTRLAEYDKLKARFSKLTPEEKQLYRDLFSTYKRLDKELEASLESNTLESIPDKKIAESAYKKIINELSKIRIDHYAPLYRKGTYWMSYMKDGELHKPLFATQVERDAARRKLEAEGATNFDMYTHIEEMTSHNAPDGTILASVIKILKDSGAGDAAIDRVAQMVIKALPESSILKSRQYREGIGGYIDDAALVFDNVSSSTIHQLANMKYGEPLQRLIKNMAATGNQLRGDDNEKARLLVQELQNRYKFIMHPNISNFAQFASTGSFFYFLAGNVSSAVVNTLQLPLIVMPQLGGTYGFGNTMRALWKAMDLYTHSGFKRKVTELSGNVSEQNAMWSLENLVNDGKAPQYKNLVEKLREFGFLQNTTARDAVTASNQTSSTYGGMSRLHYLTNLSGTFMFHHAERMNREVTAVAAYDLEKAKLQGNTKMSAEQKEAQAIDKAIRAVQYMHGAGHTETGPSIGHSNLGKVMMVFKRFAFSMYYMLFDTMRRALPLKGNDREGMVAARRQLAGMYGMSALFAGLKGLPMYWVAEAAYNALADDDEDDFDTVVRKFMGDMPYKGPVNYYTNLAIADRVGWTDLIFREARGDKADATGLSQVIESALGAPYSIANNMFRAKDLLADGHTERAIETALPIGMRNVLKGLRYSTEGVNTLRGDPVMGEVDGTSAAMQILGFAPADLSRQYETNAYIKKESARILQKRDTMAKKYYVARREGDFERAAELRQELFEFGAKYPELGIDDEYLNKSVSTRDQISSKMYHGVTIPKRLEKTMLEAANEINN